jgi:hypothetical protein
MLTSPGKLRVFAGMLLPFASAPSTTAHRGANDRVTDATAPRIPPASEKRKTSATTRTRKTTATANAARARFEQKRDVLKDVVGGLSERAELLDFSSRALGGGPLRERNQW